MYRSIISIFVLCSMFILSTASAYAHTELTATVPANNETVVTSPREIRLQFTKSILPVSIITLVNEKGENIPFQQVQVQGQEMVGLLQENIPNGTYTVNWKAAADDSHVLNGSFSFTVQVAEQGKTAEVEQEVGKQEEPIQKEETKEKKSSLWLVVFGAIGMLLIGSIAVIGFRGRKQ